MGLPQELPTPDASVEAVKVRDLMAGRQAVTQFPGHYQYEDLKTDGPVDCQWRVETKTTGLNVQGHLHGSLAVDCARCLETFPVPVDVDIDEQFVFSSYVDPYEREKELQAEDFYEVIDEEGVLDLKDLAHQFLVLETTSQSLCGRAECRLQEA